MVVFALLCVMNIVVDGEHKLDIVMNGVIDRKHIDYDEMKVMKNVSWRFERWPMTMALMIEPKEH